MFIRMLRRPRHHRDGHERVSLHDDATDNANNGSDEVISVGTMEGIAVQTPGTDNNTDLQNGIMILRSGHPTTGTSNPEFIVNQELLNPATTYNESFGEQSAESNEWPGVSTNNQSTSVEAQTHPHPTTHPFLTSQIQTERHIRQRRQSTCTLLFLFLLVRLWVEAIIQKDAGLLFLSTIGTTWTYRWWNSQREDEEEFDRQIEESGQRASGVAVSDTENRNEGQADAASTFDPDLSLMSFQAQLALAILESQRQMLENGGYGGNDRVDLHNGPGVTDEAKSKWKKYQWGGDGADSKEEIKLINRLGTSSIDFIAGEGSTSMTRASSSTTIERVGSNGSNYGSVGTSHTDSEEEDLEKRSSEVTSSKLEEGLVFSVNEEENSCSICLCDYEKGESVTRLPCNHIYHESCLDSWITNHTRCPLCNHDLMEGFVLPPRAHDQQHNNSNGRLLGRMIRARRASISRRRRLASVLATMDDSIV